MRSTDTWRFRSGCSASSRRFRSAPSTRSPIGEHDCRNRARLEYRRLAVNGLDGHASFVRRLVRQHRIAGDVADRKDRRLSGASLPVNLGEPALIHLCSGRVEPGDRGVRTRPTATSTPSKICAALGAFFPSTETASLLVVLHARHFRFELLCRTRDGGRVGSMIKVQTVRGDVRPIPEDQEHQNKRGYEKGSSDRGEPRTGRSVSHL